MKRFSLALAGLLSVVTLLNAQSAVALQGAATKGAAGGRAAGGLVTVKFTNTPLAQAVQTIAEQSGAVVLYSPKKLGNKRVTYAVSNVRAEDALVGVLKNTGIQIEKSADGTLTLLPGEVVGTARANGVLAGKVTDAKSGKAVAGANISVGNDSRAVATGDDGTYRLAGIPAGTHTVVVRLVGYAKQTRMVTVGEGATAMVDFKLEPSANVLDQVVVTGTVARTELKAVPNAITVVTAKQIEERGITRIDQLFRGDIPGLFVMNGGVSKPGDDNPLDEVFMFSRGATSLGDQNQLGTTNPIKTYIDGIEVAESKYLSQIDPKSIDRIEILTGPQASTIYGSNAINGVMQIFTKRGSTNRPQVTATLLTGFLQNNFSSSLTPQHDDALQVSGQEGRISYNAGTALYHMGAWAPAKKTTRFNNFGGARTQYGPFSADLSARAGNTRNEQRGSFAQGLAYLQATGGWSPVSDRGVTAPISQRLNSRTFGLTATYAPWSWWSHEFGIGSDISQTEAIRRAPSYATRTDTGLTLNTSSSDRRSLRYTTTARASLPYDAHLTVTLGADSWQSLASSMSASAVSLTGTIAGTPTITRQPGHNTGGFFQGQLAFRDALFFTYGVRAEWNPNFGAEAQPNLAPRYGVAYTKDLGLLTAKLRGSYGRSTRPPDVSEKKGIMETDPFWISMMGPYEKQKSNPDLGPEFQQGGEGGVELYFGSRGSLVVTRYNQTVGGLVALINNVDSVRSLQPFPEDLGIDYWLGNYLYMYQTENLNVGNIRNQGWELQGSVNTGPLSTRATYSWTKSRVIGIDKRFQSQFPSSLWQQYQPGSSFRFLPEHTWSLGSTYTRNATSVGLNLTGLGQLIVQQDNLSFELHFARRLPLLRPIYPNITRMARRQGYAMADLNASHRFSSNVEGVLQVQNLADYYRSDYTPLSPVLGRQTKFGMRVRW